MNDEYKSGVFRSRVAPLAEFHYFVWSNERGNILRGKWLWKYVFEKDPLIRVEQKLSHLNLLLI